MCKTLEGNILSSVLQEKIVINVKTLLFFQTDQLPNL